MFAKYNYWWCGSCRVVTRERRAPWWSRIKQALSNAPRCGQCGEWSKMAHWRGDPGKVVKIVGPWKGQLSHPRPKPEKGETLMHFNLRLKVMGYSMNQADIEKWNALNRVEADPKPGEILHIDKSDESVTVLTIHAPHLKLDPELEAALDSWIDAKRERDYQEAAKENVIQQAKFWKSEHDTQKATVDAVGEVLGMKDWEDIPAVVRYIKGKLDVARDEIEGRYNGGPWDFFKVMENWAKWSDSVWGENRPPNGTVNHLVEEAAELAENPTDIMEYVDVIMLAVDGLRQAGFDFAEFTDAAIKKLAINKAREWGPVDENGVSRHVKDSAKTGKAKALPTVVTIDLDDPIEVDGAKVCRLDLRMPMAADVRHITEGVDVGQMMDLACELAGFNARDLDDLNMTDTAALMNVLNRMLESFSYEEIGPSVSWEPAAISMVDEPVDPRCVDKNPRNGVIDDSVENYFSPWVTSKLTKVGIETMGDLTLTKRETILGLEGVGHCRLRGIEDVMSNHGLALRGSWGQ